MQRRATEVCDTIHGAVILAGWAVELDPNPGLPVVRTSNTARGEQERRCSVVEERRNMNGGTRDGKRGSP